VKDPAAASGPLYKKTASQEVIPERSELGVVAKLTGALYQPLPLGDLSGVTLTRGGVESYLKLKVDVPVLPAASVHRALTEAMAESGPENVGMMSQRIPSAAERDEPLVVKSRAWLYQSLESAALEGVTVTDGGVSSIFTVTEFELDKPAALVATHVNVMPTVSLVKTVLSHPDVETIPLSASESNHTTAVGELVQPSELGGLEFESRTTGSMIGGVVALAVLTMSSLKL